MIFFQSRYPLMQFVQFIHCPKTENPWHAKVQDFVGNDYDTPEWKFDDAILERKRNGHIHMTDRITRSRGTTTDTV
jgi:hypothetical protein